MQNYSGLKVNRVIENRDFDFSHAQTFSLPLIVVLFYVYCSCSRILIYTYFDLCILKSENQLELPDVQLQPVKICGHGGQRAEVLKPCHGIITWVAMIKRRHKLRLHNITLR